MPPTNPTRITAARIMPLIERWHAAAPATIDPEMVARYSKAIVAFTLWNGDSDVDAGRIQQYIDSISSTSRNAATATIAALRSLMAGFNPRIMDKVEIRRSSEGRSNDTITDAQYQSLLELTKDEDDRLLFVIMHETGMAMVDACLLGWRSVRLENRMIIGTRHKTFEEFRIPLQPDGLLIGLLKQRLATKGLDEEVCSRNAIQYRHSRQTLCLRLSRLMQRAGVPKGTGTHAFRRAYVTRLVTANIHPLHIIRMTGHASTDCLTTYSKATDTQLAEAIQSAYAKTNDRLRQYHHAENGQDTGAGP